MRARIDAIGLAIRNGWLALPEWVRKFAVDAAEGAAAAVLVLNLAIPYTLAEAQAQAIIIAAAVASPIVAAGRRYLLPGLLGILRYLFPAP